MIDHAFRPPARGTGCRALPQQPGRRTVICSSRRLREIPEPCRTEARHARYIGAITSTSPPHVPRPPPPPAALLLRCEQVFRCSSLARRGPREIYRRVKRQ